MEDKEEEERGEEVKEVFVVGKEEKEKESTRCD